jgi:ketosteroid isomerase-like protein
MKKLLLILPIVLIFCLTAISQDKKVETSSEDLEKELIAVVKEHFNAWNERDWDTYFRNGEDAIGFGRWSAVPRNKFPKTAKIFASKYFLNLMEISEYVMEEEHILYVMGNTGIVLGNIVEKAKPKNGELKEWDVRYTFTFVRSEGEWKRILYHRDVQFSK